MFLDVARPVTLIGCILSLYALFHTAFLLPSTDMNQRIYDSLTLLALAAGISVIGGLVFRGAAQEPGTGRARLTATLPVQVFCWASGTMLVVFVVSWYLGRYCIFYRDVRF
jgi:hypothetical protein